LENLDDGVVNNRAWETIRGYQNSVKGSLGYYELRQHMLWFDEGCSKLLHQRKQDILQWLKDQSQINGVNVNERHEAKRHFRKRKGKYLKDKINDLAKHSKNKNIEE
jgi:hypothetical protein